MPRNPTKSELLVTGTEYLVKVRFGACPANVPIVVPAYRKVARIFEEEYRDFVEDMIQSLHRA
jgi:hypothetical protein